MLNMSAIRSAPLKREPYPYLVTSQAILPESLAAVVRDFPPIAHPGSIPVAQSRPGPAFEQLLQERLSPALGYTGDTETHTDSAAV